MIDWKNIWKKMRKYVLNKYVLTILIFAIMFIFFGDQSLIAKARRSVQIRDLKEQISDYEKRIEETNKKIEELESSPENLERYARERYGMHADNEDVFIVEE